MKIRCIRRGWNSPFPIRSVGRQKMNREEQAHRTQHSTTHTHTHVHICQENEGAPNVGASTIPLYWVIIAEHIKSLLLYYIPWNEGKCPFVRSHRKEKLRQTTPTCSFPLCVGSIPDENILFFVCVFFSTHYAELNRYMLSGSTANQSNRMDVHCACQPLG